MPKDIIMIEMLIYTLFTHCHLRDTTVDLSLIF